MCLYSSSFLLYECLNQGWNDLIVCASCYKEFQIKNLEVLFGQMCGNWFSMNGSLCLFAFHIPELSEFRNMCLCCLVQDFSSV
jgi:hypothetical protein